MVLSVDDGCEMFVFLSVFIFCRAGWLLAICGSSGGVNVKQTKGLPAPVRIVIACDPLCGGRHSSSLFQM